MQQKHKLSLQVFEVLQRASGLNDAQQAQVFREYPYPAVAQLLQIYFGDFEQAIPNTAPPGAGTGSSEESHPTSLHKQMANGGLARFMKNAGFDNLNAHQRERQYMRLLEGIHPRDAEMVIALFKGDGSFERLYQISQAGAHAAFPKVIPAPAPEPVHIRTRRTGDDPQPAREMVELPPIDDGPTPLDFSSGQTLEVDAVHEGLVLADVSGPIKFSGTMNSSYDFSGLDENSFVELRRAIMREDHKRKREAG